MRAKRYMVYWSDDGDNRIDYIQALYATQAVEFLGIPEEAVIEVAVVLENWRNSKPRGEA